MTSRKFSIDLMVSFTQAYRPILERVNSHLQSEGIQGGTPRTERGGRISRLIFVSNLQILQVLKNLLPSLRIKAEQARATIDYLEDRMTGNEFLAIMNSEIGVQKRGGDRHEASYPWLRSEGIRMTRLNSISYARAVHKERRSSPDARERERSKAIERNFRRGFSTQRKVLTLLVNRPLTTGLVAHGMGRTWQHTRLLLKGLYERGLLVRNHSRITEPFEYSLTPLGRSYLSDSGGKDIHGLPPPHESVL